MSDAAITGGANGAGSVWSDLKSNPAKYVGTGPTPVEQKAAEKIGEVASKVKDSVVNFVKSTDARVIAASSLLAVLPGVPVVGKVIALGVAGGAALNYLTKNSPAVSTTARALGSAATMVAGAAITPVNPIAGVSLMAAGAVGLASEAVEANKTVKTVTGATKIIAGAATSVVNPIVGGIIVASGVADIASAANTGKSANKNIGAAAAAGAVAGAALGAAAAAKAGENAAPPADKPAVEKK